MYARLSSDVVDGYGPQCVKQIMPIYLQKVEDELRCPWHKKAIFQSAFPSVGGIEFFAVLYQLQNQFYKVKPGLTA